MSSTRQITTFSGFPIDRDFGTIEEFVKYEDALWYSLRRYADECGTISVQIFFTIKDSVIEKRGTTHFVFLPRYKPFKSILRLIKEIRKSSILHVNELFPTHVTLMTGIIAKLCRVKTIHFIQTAPNFSKVSRLDRFFLRLYFSLIDGIFVYTNYLEDKYHNDTMFKGIKTPISVFPAGVNTSIFKPIKSLNNNNGVNGESKLRVLFVGRIDQEKKIEDIVEAIVKPELRTKVIMWIVGGIADQSYFNEICDRLNFADIPYKYFGLVEHINLPPIYSAADVFVNMRPDEGFGKVFIESMACGTPVIGIRGSPGPEEIIKNGYNGFIVKDSKELSELLSRLSENKDLIKNISSNCVSFAHENYTYDKSYEVFKKVHDKLLEIEGIKDMTLLYNLKAITNLGVHEAVHKMLNSEVRGILLDAGAGEGKLAYELSRKGFSVIACDADPERFKAPINCIKTDLNSKLPFDDKMFDYVLCVEVIEHLKNPWFAINEFRRILKPSGKLIFSTPNIHHLRSRIKFLMHNEFYGFNASEISSLDEHIHPFTHWEIKLILHENGFKIEKISYDRAQLPILSNLPLIKQLVPKTKLTGNTVIIKAIRIE